MAESPSERSYTEVGSRIEQIIREAEDRSKSAQAEADGARLRAGQCPECLRRERGILGRLRRRR